MGGLHDIDTQMGKQFLTHTTQQHHDHSLWFSACPGFWFWSVSMMSDCYFASYIVTTGTGFIQGKKIMLNIRHTGTNKKHTLYLLTADTQLIKHITRFHQDKPHFRSAFPSWWFRNFTVLSVPWCHPHCHSMHRILTWKTIHLF
jgi:hypothetical protein